MPHCGSCFAGPPPAFVGLGFYTSLDFMFLVALVAGCTIGELAFWRAFSSVIIVSRFEGVGCSRSKLAAATAILLCVTKFMVRCESGSFFALFFGALCVQEFLHHISPRLYVRVYKFGYVAVIYRSSIVFRWHASNSLSSFCCGFAVCFCMLRNHFGACPHITLPFMGPRRAHGSCVLLEPRSGNQHMNIPI